MSSMPSSDSGKIVVSNGQRAVVVLLCSIFLYIADVIPDMFSPRANRRFLMLTVVFFTFYSIMWAYAATVLSKKKVKLLDDHKPLLLTATCCGLLGSLCWVIGMWPFFHIFTVPIWLVVVVLVVNLHGISIPVKRKSAKRS